MAAVWPLGLSGVLFVYRRLIQLVEIDYNELNLADSITWSLFYGAALLSTFLFASRSILYLGLSIFVTSTAFCILNHKLGYYREFVPFLNPYIDNYALPTLMMFLCFGVYHLTYAFTVKWTAPWRS